MNKEMKVALSFVIGAGIAVGLAVAKNVIRKRIELIKEDEIVLEVEESK